jgi:hypothetical protein
MLAHCCACGVNAVLSHHRCRAELAAKSAARKERKAEGAQDTSVHSLVRDSFSERQMAAVPHTGAFRKAEEHRSQSRAVENSQSMPELGSKEYNVDDWQDDEDEGNDTSGDKGSPRSGLHDNAAAHGVLPRLNITQRWDTFDISARCALVASNRVTCELGVAELTTAWTDSISMHATLCALFPVPRASRSAFVCWSLPQR